MTDFKAKLNPEDFTAYQASLNAYRDMKNSIDTALEEGEIKGKIEGKMEVARNSLKAGLGIETMAKITGLRKGEIEDLKIAVSGETDGWNDSTKALYGETSNRPKDIRALNWILRDER